MGEVSGYNIFKKHIIEKPKKSRRLTSTLLLAHFSNCVINTKTQLFYNMHYINPKIPPYYEPLKARKTQLLPVNLKTEENLQKIRFRHIQFSSVVQSCLTLCNPMNRSTPGLPVHHQLPEFTQTHVHRVGDAIQPSHIRGP